VIAISPAVRIFIATTPVDLRKSIDGLRAIVEEEIEEDAYSGHLFVFVSRRCDRVKILAWDKGGFVLLYKRLLCGQPHNSRYAKPAIMRSISRGTCARGRCANRIHLLHSCKQSA
jgi:transposase